MLKIRDLGISVIPATMRPPEIGGGAAEGRHPMYLTVDQTPLCQSAACPCEGPTPPPKPGPKPGEKPPPGPPPPCGGPTPPPPKQNAAGLTDDAVAQLRQQLRQQINDEYVN